MNEKQILFVARVMSVIFTPFYLPIVGMLLLFLFSYMSLLPLNYKIIVLLIVYLFTILLPTFLIHLYRKYQGWNLIELGFKERRMVPYIISIVCYFTCYYVMQILHIPDFMARLLVTALVMQVLCAIINVWWKISTHTAAIGAVVGALMAFAIPFSFNPTWWLCLTFIIGGMVGTGRIILKQHSVLQVVTGFLLGWITALITI